MRVDLKLSPKTQSLQQFAGFGGTSPSGTELAVNSRWLSRNGKPWVPVMGEFHFSRFPRVGWEESLGKIRAGGVGVVATYLFWIHHEEAEGRFRWDAGRDLGAFVRACAKVGLDVFLRIGPWAHGECRNGGFPNWLMEKPFPIRGNDPQYLALVKRFYKEIALQVEGLLFMDDGPIIGIQLENEYGHCGGLQGEEGLRHMGILKMLALEAGLEAPLYTATGWGGAMVVQGEMLPVLGGYADAPWAQHTEPLPPNDMFAFSPLVPDTDIGSDLAANVPQRSSPAFTYDLSANPYLTAELGGGLQVTHHRRPIVDAADVEAMTLVKLGCGANLLGYYMYHGGTNPEGELSTLQESRASGYANDLPVLSYDFQAPIGESGLVNRSWRNLRLLHLFLADYGDRLAAMPSQLPSANTQDPSDLEGLRCALRTLDGSGFLFVNRHQRGAAMTDLDGVVFQLSDGTAFPSASLRSGRCHIWPFGMDLSGIRLNSATAQPLCRLDGPDCTTHVFFAHGDTGAELRFEDGSSLRVAPGARESIRFPAPAAGAKDTLKWVDVLVLTRTDAEQALKMRLGGQDVLLVTDALAVQEVDNRISLTSFSPDNLVFVYPQAPDSDFSDSLLAHAAAIGGAARLEFCGVNGRNALRVRFAPSNGRAAVERTARIGTRSQEMTAKKALWRTNAYPPEEMCHLLSELRLEAPDAPGVHDWFLRLEPEGDAARLIVDGKLRGDWFYTGNPWWISLKRLGKNGPVRTVRIEVDPLQRTDAVYLEKHPPFHNGEACCLRSIQLRPQYRCLIEFL